MGNSVILPWFIVHQFNHQKSLTHFWSNFEFFLDYIANRNPFVSIIIGDFNARSNNWCSSDKTTYEGKKLESLTSQCGFKQVISDPTHILESSSSCIDLIFTSQPNLVMNSGVHTSLHHNCHHQIIYAKFNLKKFLSTSIWTSPLALSRCK